MISGKQYFDVMHPDILQQFLDIKDTMEDLGCQVVSTTLWSLVVSIHSGSLPKHIPNVCIAGQFLAGLMKTAGWNGSEHHHSNIDPDMVYITIPYNLHSA